MSCIVVIFVLIFVIFDIVGVLFILEKDWIGCTAYHEEEVGNFYQNLFSSYIILLHYFTLHNFFSFLFPFIFPFFFSILYVVI